MNEHIEAEMIRFVKEAYFEKKKKIKEIACQLGISMRKVSRIIKSLKGELEESNETS